MRDTAHQNDEHLGGLDAKADKRGNSELKPQKNKKKRTCAASMPEMSMVGLPAVLRRSTRSVTSDGCWMPRPHRMCASDPAENLCRIRDISKFIVTFQ